MLLILMARQASDLVQLSLQDRSWIDQLEAIDLTCVRHSAFSGTEHNSYGSDLTELGSSVASWAFQNIGGLFSSSTRFILHTFLFFLSLYYLLVDRDRLYKRFSH